ncbi:hypothetical protein ABH935_005509 [Catenulispora sp. GAS73]|uniref:hypothetical protein n=1 Tax=Catenulispora sp. GAS73 TaxID=3156269 RepID=UPI00351571DF
MVSGRQPGERLADWLEMLSPVLDRLAFFVPQDFARDFSVSSLDALEAVLTAPNQAAGDTGLVESAMAYLGEALMRVGGGRWTWDDDPENPPFKGPVILLDDALGLPPLSPLQVMVDARLTGTRTEFRKVHDRLRTAVAEYQDSHPGWTPTKEHSSGVDPVGLAELPPPDPWLTGWLAGREADFPRWAAECGGTGEWQFTLATIDGLERLFLDRFATVEQSAAPENEVFVATASWVLGETVRRADPGGVVWRYYPVPPEYADFDDYFAKVGNPYVGSPVLYRFPDVEFADPRVLLQIVVEDREPGWLARRLADYLAPVTS